MLTHGAASAETDNARKLNVLFIVVDDLNHWVGHLGRNPQTKTPNIDRLAARGVAFSNAYCAAPLCNSSRAAALSGLRPFTSGVYHNRHDWRTVIPSELTLPSVFRQAGYDTATAGKLFHGHFSRNTDWEESLKNAGEDPAPTGDTGLKAFPFSELDCTDEEMKDWRIAEYGIQQLRKTHERPFFLSLGFQKPHLPWNVPRKYFDLHPLNAVELAPIKDDDLDDIPPAGKKVAHDGKRQRSVAESGRAKEAVQAYLAAISFVDAQIGRVIDALDDSPYRDNTIIVLWGDHGWHLGEKQHWSKFTLWEEATRAPLIWVAPGVTTPGTVSHRIVDFMTIYPTLTDLAGIATPEHVQGKSLCALLQNPDAPWDEPAITTFNRNNHAVRTQDWRYIRYSDGSEELYDERQDPHEWTNLAGDPDHAATKRELARFLPQQNAPAIETTVFPEDRPKADAKLER